MSASELLLAVFDVGGKDCWICWITDEPQTVEGCWSVTLQMAAVI
jgi:hypothetical protein